MSRTACGPKGQDGNRAVVGCQCTRDCPHYQACLDEIGVLPPEHEFKEADATIGDMLRGKFHTNYEGKYKAWRMIRIKNIENEIRDTRVKRARAGHVR
ncbi:TPA: hypothetical protein HA234_07310 [Candidatus Woesearchaeota archaeon]|nr:hypothetical protein [Candidatus Woesearchaeota archaeon]